MLLDDILHTAVENHASDIHLEAGMPPILRIHKQLIPIQTEPLTGETIKDMVYSMMKDKQKQEIEKNLECDFSYGVKGLARFRVNAYFQRGTMAVALRAIPFQIPSLDYLGVPHVAHKLIREERGLILVTGPTGHGKSTTLAAMVDEINTNYAKHIITIEDPIEYLFTNKQSLIAQREVGGDTMSFPNALRSALREDPDILLVGEMRDLETIATALTAAETGHLVFATLHTNSAAQSIDRIVDVFPPYQQAQIRTQLSAVLLAVFSQQLIPRSDEKGLVLASEVLITNPAVRNLIRDNKTFQIPSLMQTSEKEGMQTMEMALRNLVRNGDITEEQALSYAFDKNNLNSLLRR
jgi:twitching motility protein PilT